MESVQRPINIFQGFFGFFFTAVILIYIMSGIMSLTAYPFSPFVFIQSYYGWVIGFIIYCLILEGKFSENERKENERKSGHHSEKSETLKDLLNGGILLKIFYYSLFAPIVYVMIPLGLILYLLICNFIPLILTIVMIGIALTGGLG